MTNKKQTKRLPAYTEVSRDGAHVATTVTYGKGYVSVHASAGYPEGDPVAAVTATRSASEPTTPETQLDTASRLVNMLVDGVVKDVKLKFIEFKTARTMSEDSTLAPTHVMKASDMTTSQIRWVRATAYLPTPGKPVFLRLKGDYEIADQVYRRRGPFLWDPDRRDDMKRGWEFEGCYLDSHEQEIVFHASEIKWWAYLPATDKVEVDKDEQTAQCSVCGAHVQIPVCDESLTFISYDGKYPNLCRGTLVFEKGGRTYEWRGALISNGSITTDEDNHLAAYKGEWSIAVPEEDQDSFTAGDLLLLEQLVNVHVKHGCCGGCI